MKSLSQRSSFYTLLAVICPFILSICIATITCFTQLCVAMYQRLSVLGKKIFYESPGGAKVTVSEDREIERYNVVTISWGSQQQPKLHHPIGQHRYSTADGVGGINAYDATENGKNRFFKKKHEAKDNNKIDRKALRPISDKINKSIASRSLWCDRTLQGKVFNATQRIASSQYNEDEDGDIIMEEVSDWGYKPTDASGSLQQDKRHDLDGHSSETTLGQNTRRLYLFSCDAIVNVVECGGSCYYFKKEYKTKRSKKIYPKENTIPCLEEDEIICNGRSSKPKLCTWWKEIWNREKPFLKERDTRPVLNTKTGGSHEGELKVLESKMPISLLKHPKHFSLSKGSDLEPTKIEIATRGSLQGGDKNIERCYGTRGLSGGDLQEACLDSLNAETNVHEDFSSNSFKSAMSSYVRNDASLDCSEHVCNLRFPEAAVDASTSTCVLQPLSVSSNNITTNVKSGTAKCGLHKNVKLDTSTDFRHPNIQVKTSIDAQKKVGTSSNNGNSQHLEVPTYNDSKEPELIYKSQSERKQRVGDQKPNNSYGKCCNGKKDRGSVTSEASVLPNVSVQQTEDWREPRPVATSHMVGAIRKKMPPLIRDPKEVASLTMAFPVNNKAPSLKPSYLEKSDKDSEKEQISLCTDSCDAKKRGWIVESLIEAKPGFVAGRKLAVPKRSGAAAIRKLQPGIEKWQADIAELRSDYTSKLVTITLNPEHLGSDSDGEETFCYTGPGKTKKRGAMVEPSPGVDREPENSAVRTERSILRRSKAIALGKRKSHSRTKPEVKSEVLQISAPEPSQTLELPVVLGCNQELEGLHGDIPKEKTLLHICSGNGTVRPEPENAAIRWPTVRKRSIEAMKQNPHAQVVEDPAMLSEELMDDDLLNSLQTLGSPVGDYPGDLTNDDSGTEEFISTTFGEVKNAEGTVNPEPAVMRVAYKRSVVAMKRKPQTPLVLDNVLDELPAEPLQILEPPIHYSEELAIDSKIEKGLLFNDPDGVRSVECSVDPEPAGIRKFQTFEAVGKHTPQSQVVCNPGVIAEPMDQSPTEPPSQVVDPSSKPVPAQMRLTFWESLMPVPWKLEPPPEPMEVQPYTERTAGYTSAVEKPDVRIEMMDYHPIQQPSMSFAPPVVICNAEHNQDEDMETSISYAEWMPAYQPFNLGANVEMEEMP